MREVLLDGWLDAYSAATSWRPEILEIEAGGLGYLFDAAPTLGETGMVGDDRVVAVWGRSQRPTSGRNRGRMAGFLPGRAAWSARGRDRGHLVAHAAGGGLDMNLVPQDAALNRGRSSAGRRWRAMERKAAEHPGTPLFVRPVYTDSSWVPTQIEYGLVVANRVFVERFVNSP